MPVGRLSCTLLVCITIGAAGAAAQNQNGAGYRPDTITLGASGRPAEVREGTPSEVALRYLRENQHALRLTEADLRDIVVTSSYQSEHNGVTHVYLRQRHAEIEVQGAEAAVHIARDGSILTANSSFFPQLTPAVNRTTPVRGAADALKVGARSVKLQISKPLSVIETKGGPAQATVFNDAGIATGPIAVRLVYQPMGPGEVRLAWLVEIDQRGGQHAWSVTVDAETAAILHVENLVIHDAWGVPDAASGRKRTTDTRIAGTLGRALARSAGSPASPIDGAAYNVFALPKESPSDGPRTLLSDPADPASSPFGWHDTNGATGAEFTVTRGNNVHAYTDIDANNVPDTGSDPDGGSGLQFDFPLDLSLAPNTYRPAAVTNLFYWTNIMHDVTARYGFDEAAGNFQVTNYSGVPGGGDDVRAEAQDGSGTNSANFFTPPQGGNPQLRPRMQMFIWTHPLPNLVTVNAPVAIAGDYTAAAASFGAPVTGSGLAGDVVLVNDGVGTTSDACEPLVGFPANAIALIDRGNCEFGFKALTAQQAGASGVIVINDAAGNPFVMGPGVVGHQVTIAATMVSLDDGNLFRANIPVNATIRLNPAPIHRDSDLDAGIIAHEYGHGISNRLTGGPSTVSCLSNTEQMGEGWSDYMALIMTPDASDTGATHRGVGSYLIFGPPSGGGLRPTPYTTDMSVNPSTYATIADTDNISVPFGVGYVWATMLWEMYWNLVGKHGFNADLYDDWTSGGNNLAIQLVMDGMKFQPCRPGFVDGRNAILAADVALTGGGNQCLIWKAFAKRGLGASASQGSSLSRTDGVQAFDLPASCLAGASVSPASLASTQVSNTSTTKSFDITNTSAADGTNLTWTITEAASDCASPSDVPWLSASPLGGTVAPGASSTVSVTFDSTALGVGTYAGKLCIAGNGTGVPMKEVPVSMTVIYTFTGFFPPVANPPALNAVIATSIVSIKFSTGGNFGLNILSPQSPASRRVECSTLAPEGPFQAASSVTGLAYDAASNQYIYLWRTERNWSGTCREFSMTLNDGTAHTAFFRFSRP